ncbi:MAG: hypothetical protein H0A75_06200 [Candidatus Methanofishera endochildressiae]|uniref:Uncharacterized protein n=1 Tax=Candidatus Methanofishera endochildressiae TaxID=2738884 RepID=A0A7Z0MP38_9GAMM|nr:hypothetical protein [Candidatus Methanofishera endochildressiae]
MVSVAAGGYKKLNRYITGMEVGFQVTVEGACASGLSSRLRQATTILLITAT